MKPPEDKGKEPKAAGPEALQNGLNSLKLSQEREQYKAKVAEEIRVALERTEGLIGSLAIYYDYENRAYWVKWNNDDYWSRVQQRDVKMLFRLKGLKAREVGWVMLIIRWDRSIPVLGPAKAQKARLWEFDGEKGLIADFREPVLSDDQIAELRLDRNEWYLDVDGRGKTIARSIINNNWEDAIPQIAHALIVIDVKWGRRHCGTYDCNLRNYKRYLKDWVKGLQRQGGVA
jgi:hypothetical protein